MFTGLVEAIGCVSRIYPTGAVVRLCIEAPFTHELKKGQSVCVSGACLTVVDMGRDFTVEMMRETVNRTKFRSLAVGSRVNLERALRVGDRLDGHFVQGHVDGAGVVRGITSGDMHIVTIAADSAILRQIVPKGSVALDGVSLTVIDAGAECFSVGLIPTTLNDCTLGTVKAGDELNIETDIIGKYILSQNRSNAPLTRDSAVTINKLAEMGYI